MKTCKFSPSNLPGCIRATPPAQKNVRKTHKGWGYVNKLKQIEAQMQYRLWYAQNAKAILCTKKSEKTVGNGMFSNKN